MRFLQRIILITGLLCTELAMANALRIPGPHTDRVHHTQIKATLNTENHRVTASMNLRWKNTTSVALTEIPFHMYLNAFSATDTIFMQESNGGQLRNDRRDGDDKENFGFIQVTKITNEEGTNLFTNWSMNNDVAILKLPKPLQPNEEITLNIDFHSQLPKVFARSGHNGDSFNFVAQWFPKPGVYKNGAWVNHNYHANSEFFADFGNYDVEISAPNDFIVGATGYRANKVTHGDLTTHHYIAEDVHDFAWTADSKFGDAEINWQGIKIRLLHQIPLDEQSIQNQFDAAKASFTWFEENVGPYPYSTMTLVQPPKDAGGAGGMEYPTLVTTITNLDYSEYQRAAAMVTIHEIGHNYWQGIFASNEFEESWMDEGINSYTEGRIMAETMKQKNVAQFGPFALEIPTVHHSGTARTATVDPVNTKSWEFINNRSYSTNSYSKPATILNTAERIWGVDKVDALLKAYYQKWAFKHPDTHDFLAIAASIDKAMANYLDLAINTTKTIDLKVALLKSQKKESPGGYLLKEDATEPEFKAAEESDIYQNNVTLLRSGDLYPPEIEVLLTFADGSSETRSWSFKNDVAWQKWQWDSDAQLVEVFIDPEFTLLLDKDFSNNVKRIASESHQSWRWALPLIQTLQNSLSIIFPL